MFNINDFLFLIPARKNSKELKNKNILKINGQALIEKTFKVLKNISYSKKFVLTDSDIIKKIAKKHHINIDYKRPKKLSGGNIELVDNILHFNNFIRNFENDFKYYVILQPTSPLRSKQDLFSALNYFSRKKFSSLFSASRSIEHPSDTFFLKKKKIHFFYKKKSSLRQNYEKSYYINGAIYIFDKKLLKSKKLISNKNHGIYFMSKINSLDIDDIEDYYIYRKLVKI